MPDGSYPVPHDVWALAASLQRFLSLEFGFESSLIPQDNGIRVTAKCGFGYAIIQVSDDDDRISPEAPDFEHPGPWFTHSAN